MERTQRIVCRISTGEMGIVERAADRASLPLSTFVRAAAIAAALAVLERRVLAEDAENVPGVGLVWAP